MNAQLDPLWQRLQAYALDDPDADFPFHERLARDNGWTPAHARRVGREYLRFAYLAMRSGHPVTPSDAVDQAWHLHLLHTRSYWEDFCSRVLGRPLHHQPTRGGPAERAKFQDWYERTLASYRIAFDEEPPVDLWPPALQRFGDDLKFVRVNAARHWILPRPRVSLGGLRRRFRELPFPSLGYRLAMLALATVLAGCSVGWGMGADTPETGNRTFFALVGSSVVMLAAGCAMRWGGRARPTPDVGGFGDLHPYAAAFLAGGPSRTLHAVLAHLAESGVIEVAAKAEGKPDRLANVGSRPSPGHPLEIEALDRIGSTEVTSMASLLHPRPGALRDVRASLERRGLLRARLWCQVLPILFTVAPAVFACVLRMSGTFDGSLDGYVVGFLVGSIVVALVAFGSETRPTPLGDAVLQSLQRSVSPQTASRAPESSSDATGAGVVMDVALTGLPAFRTASLVPLREWIEKSEASAGGCGGCGGSGGCGG
ncbi:MAG: TIGR04222 domain-containing membrane protein [Verrucomicrobiales bacterium]|nr:TIGR04222 domain-containing membrane protein [Verrucomicrobiales bacterium]